MPVAWRLSLFYAVYFFIVGVQLPFWPVWLTAHGLSAGEIALLLAAALWLKVVTNPLAGWLADRIGERRRLMVALAVATLASFGLLARTAGFWPLLVINGLNSAAFSALMPLGDNLTITLAQERRLDYGRTRVWGSIAFILAALGTGTLLHGRSPDWILGLLIGATVVALISCLALPAYRFRRAGAARHAWRRLVVDPRLLLFLGAATAIQASHSVYYAFGTLHWKTLGFTDETIGFLWSEGVIAEIALFALGARLVVRLGAARLLVLAGLAGTVRWGLTGAVAALPLLLALQLLHALSFGAAHLAAMQFLGRALPPELSATGQALYSATVSGVGFGLVMALSGPLYAAVGAGAYTAMALLALVGGVIGWCLGRVWRGEQLTS